MKHATIKARATRLPVQQKSYGLLSRKSSTSTVLLNNENNTVPKLLESQNPKVKNAISKDVARARIRSRAGDIFSHIRRRKNNAERGGCRQWTENETSLASMKAELASRSLPRSPLMARVEQRPIPSKELAKGMAARRLVKNPWGNMLASPLRMCNATHARIPRDLLATFNFVRAPTGSKTYLMPLALADLDSLRQWKTLTSKDQVLKTTEPFPEKSLDNAQSGAENTVSDEAEECKVIEDTNVPPSQAKFYEGYPQRPERSVHPEQSSPSQPAMFLIPRMSLIRYTALAIDRRNPPSPELYVTPRLFPQRLMHLEASDRKDGILWRRDMPELIASLLKRRLIAAMENVVQTKVDRKRVPLLVPLDNVEANDILQGAHTGAILSLDGKGHLPEDIRAAFATRFPNAKRPLQYTADPFLLGLPQRNIPVLPLADDTSIPIFAIQHLLEQMSSGVEQSGPGCLRELRDLLQLEHSQPLSTWWLLRSSHASSVQAIKEIWRLSQYTMYDGDTEEFVAADVQRNIKWRR